MASTAAAASLVWPRRAIAELDLRRPIRDGFAIPERRRFEPGEIAAKALDAARASGASYADIRVDQKIRQNISIGANAEREYSHGIEYDDDVGFGIRVIADGQWGFVSYSALSVDAAVDAARRAVRQAQVNAKGRRTRLELVPVPVVPDGRWATPIVTDPFTVAVGEQQEALRALVRVARGVVGVSYAGAGVTFERLDRAYASTDGSHIAQTFFGGFPVATVEVTIGGTRMGMSYLPFESQAAGYEMVRDAHLAETFRQGAQDAVTEAKALAASPPRSVDVGRYELVVGPRVLAGLVWSTILPALGMGRALGRRVSDEGTSYASPPEKVLGTMPLGAPYLTVRGDRTTPGGLMTVGWDDEGVKPDPVTFVEHGVVTDYLALREDAPRLASWYQSRGGSPQAHGLAATVSWGRPQESVPNLTIAPGSGSASVDEMIKDVKRGVYLTGDGDAYPDFGLMNAYANAQKAYEIRNGKLAGGLADLAIQFPVQRFWQGLVGLGGANAVEVFPLGGGPYILSGLTARSVPARFKSVNVVNTGRTR